MAGGAQNTGGAATQQNPQAGQQFQSALQNYRQGAAGMPSQVPGANVAAAGNQMPQLNPQTADDIEKLLQYYKQQKGQGFAEGGEISGYANGGMPGMSGTMGAPVGQMLPVQRQNVGNAGMATNAALANQQAALARPQIMSQAPVQGPQIAPQRPQIMPQAPVQGPQIAPQRPVDPRMAQNPGMTPNLGMMNRGMGQPVSAPMPGRNIAPQRPQIQGNPNATPVSKALRPQGRR